MIKGVFVNKELFLSPVCFDLYPDNCIKKIDNGWIFKLSIDDLGELTNLDVFNELVFKQCIFASNFQSGFRQKHVKLFQWYKHPLDDYSKLPHSVDVEIPFDLRDLISEIREKVYHDKKEEVVNSINFVGFPTDLHIFLYQPTCAIIVNINFGTFHKNYDGPENKIKLNFVITPFITYDKWGVTNPVHIRKGCSYSTFILKNESSGDPLEDILFFKYKTNSEMSIHFHPSYFPDLTGIEGMYPESWGLEEERSNDLKRCEIIPFKD